MCFGCCACTRISYFVSNTLYVFEKLAGCLAATAMVTCLIVTMIFMISIGIGLGYNYCFVDLKTAKYAPEPDYDEPIRPHYPRRANISSLKEKDSKWDSNSNDFSADTRRVIVDDATPFENSNNSTDFYLLARKRREERKPNLLVAFLRSRTTDIKSVTDLVKIQ